MFCPLLTLVRSCYSVIWLWWPTHQIYWLQVDCTCAESVARTLAAIITVSCMKCVCMKHYRWVDDNCSHRVTIRTKDNDHAGDEELCSLRLSYLEQPTSHSVSRNSFPCVVCWTSEGPPVWLIGSASEDYLWRALQIHSSSSSSSIVDGWQCVVLQMLCYYHRTLCTSPVYAHPKSNPLVVSVFIS